MFEKPTVLRLIKWKLFNLLGVILLIPAPFQTIYIEIIEQKGKHFIQIPEALLNLTDIFFSHIFTDNFGNRSFRNI